MVGSTRISCTTVQVLTMTTGSRGPGVLDDFTASYGYRFSDQAGYQWPTTSAVQPTNKL